jgi:anti-sigma regulatory factor (Ser/Thr protein kinase)
MGVSPPYLIGPDAGQHVSVESDVEAAVAMLTVRGRWGRALWQAASCGLRKCFAEHPAGLIVDLTALQDEAAESAPTWVTAQRAAGRMAPPVQMAMCVPAELTLADRLQRLGARRFLPVYATVRQARVALEGRLPLADRRVLTLDPDADAPALARDMIGEACRSWHLPRLLYPGRLVMSELVTNAVEHAASSITVVVSRRGTGLHISVSDHNPALPRLLDLTPPRRGEPLDERGRGLRTVHATATAWGTMPTATGKIVWATVRDPEPMQPLP